MKYFLWWPGYLMIAIGYFFPSEWSKTRSTSKSYRRWKYKDQLAPWFSIPWYLLFILILMPK